MRKGALTKLKALLLASLAATSASYADGIVLESYGRDGTDRGRYERSAANYMRDEIKEMFAEGRTYTYKECQVSLVKKDKCYHLKVSKPLGEELDVLIAADANCAPVEYKNKALATYQKLLITSDSQELQTTGHRLFWKMKSILEFDLWGSSHKVGGYIKDLLKITMNRKTDEITAMSVSSTKYEEKLFRTSVKHFGINCDEY